MSTWIKKSPYRAAGIYISGDSRACQRQSNLTADLGQQPARRRLAPDADHARPAGLVLLALPALRLEHRPEDQPEHGQHLPRPRAPRASPRRAKTVRPRGTSGSSRAARCSTTSRRSPTSSSACRDSALWFLTAWTQELHRWRYASGVYSSAASGIRMLDDARVRAGNAVHDARPGLDRRLEREGQHRLVVHPHPAPGCPTQRAHQYQGGHNETWGGVRINIDRNYLDLRTPRLPGVATPPPAPAPAPPTAHRATRARPSRTRRAPRPRSASRPTSRPAPPPRPA